MRELRGPGRRRPVVAALVLSVVTAVSIAPARRAVASFLDPASATATVSTDTLAAPTNLTAGLCLVGAVTLGWTATSTWADGYEIRWGTSSGGPYSQGPVTSAVTTQTVTGLSLLTTHYFVVRAVDGAWRSPYSAERSVPC